MKTPLKLTDNLKEVCIACFEKFLIDEYIPSGRSSIYDHLSKHNYIILSKDELWNYYNEAKRILTAEEMKKPEKQRKLDLITRKRSLFVIFKSKALILETYFARIDAEGKHLKEILI